MTPSPQPPREYCGALSGNWLPPGNANVFSWFAHLRSSELVGFDLPLGLMGFYWELVRPLSLHADDRRLIHLVLLCTHLIMERGSTRVPLRGPDSIEALMDHIPPGVLPMPPREVTDRFVELLAQGALRGLVTAGDGIPSQELLATETAPFYLCDGFLGVLRILSQERTMEQDLESLLKAPLRPDVTLTPNELSMMTSGGRRRTLDPAQQAAVEQAARQRLTIVTGGPGTGKTSVILGILRARLRLTGDGFRFAMAAPTGKAAYRMCQSVLGALPAHPSDEDRCLARQVVPFTLHRLLEYSHRRNAFGRSRDNPLSMDLIIVDEASMVELPLMASLLAALGEGTALVLTGDPHQLPPVGGGAVLRDLVAPPARNVTVLQTNHRSDQRITAAAACVRDGDAFSLVTSHITPADRVDPEAGGVFHIEVESPDSLTAFLEQWAAEADSLPHLWDLLGDTTLDPADGFAAHRELLARAFACLETSALVCATNELDRGTTEINTWFHRRHPSHRARPDNEPLPGEPVIVLSNQYHLQLFNGDVGIVCTIVERGERTRAVLFRKGEEVVPISLGSLSGHLALAYSITVHKSQGSEYDTVALVPPPGDHPILTRALLYTAMTRAKRRFYFLGDAALLARSVGRQTHRHTDSPPAREAP